MYDVSYDAHPMAILTSAFAYLGSYYSEANPSLQGSLHSTIQIVQVFIKYIYRSNSLHKRRQGISGCHGQADLQTHWEGYHVSCVSSTSFLPGSYF